MIKDSQAINVTQSAIDGFDMSSEEQRILIDIEKRTGFKSEKNIWKSSYWGKGLGASHWLGDFEGKEAVLKIQGAKPAISEIVMIEQFASQNKSKFVRPPILFNTIPWNDEQKYEALIMEYVAGQKVLQSKVLQTPENIRNFLRYYEEYRNNSLPERAWIDKPETVPSLKRVMEEIYTASLKNFPDHPFRQKEDRNLIDQSVDVLQNVYKDVNLEFMHGHFSVEDLIYESEGSDVVVLFSNLFWKWKYPFYDAIFGYSWFMYELSHIEGITPKQVDEQRKFWLDAITNLSLVKNTPNGLKLLNAALLERVTSGLIIDMFLVPQDKYIAQYLMDSTREEIKRLIDILK